MEFFHASIYGSGYGEVYTNAYDYWNPDTGKLEETKGHVLLEIRLKDTEINALKEYLERVLKIELRNDNFETYMAREFYIGTPVDSYFYTERFLKVCRELGIAPFMRYYRCRVIKEVNKK